MKNAYPIVMTQGKEFIVVFVPDFNINTQGKDVPDAIEMARDAIGLMGIDMQDDVKKNCTIPSWLNFEAERAGVNFSAVLQAALKSELHITSR